MSTKKTLDHYVIAHEPHGDAQGWWVSILHNGGDIASKSSAEALALRHYAAVTRPYREQIARLKTALRAAGVRPHVVDAIAEGTDDGDEPVTN